MCFLKINTRDTFVDRKNPSNLIRWCSDVSGCTGTVFLAKAGGWGGAGGGGIGGGRGRVLFENATLTLSSEDV